MRGLQWSSNACESGVNLTGNDANGSVWPSPRALWSMSRWIGYFAAAGKATDAVASISPFAFEMWLRYLSSFRLSLKSSCGCGWAALCLLISRLTCARARRRAVASPWIIHSKLWIGALRAPEPLVGTQSAASRSSWPSAIGQIPSCKSQCHFRLIKCHLGYLDIPLDVAAFVSISG
jgi:hypothetical protein